MRKDSKNKISAKKAFGAAALYALGIYAVFMAVIIFLFLPFIRGVL